MSTTPMTAAQPVIVIRPAVVADVGPDLVTCLADGGALVVSGLLADRWGRLRTIALGYLILAASVAVIALGASDARWVTVALILLGLGWSASTVAGAALLTEASAPALRVRRQGRNDAAMSLLGALGAIAAGGILGWIGFEGLALLTLPVILLVVALAPFGRR